MRDRHAHQDELVARHVGARGIGRDDVGVGAAAIGGCALDEHRVAELGQRPGRPGPARVGCQRVARRVAQARLGAVRLDVADPGVERPVGVQEPARLLAVLAVAERVQSALGAAEVDVGHAGLPCVDVREPQVARRRRAGDPRQPHAALRREGVGDTPAVAVGRVDVPVRRLRGRPVAAALRLADHGGIPGDGVGRSGDGGLAEGGRAGQHGQEERRQGAPTAGTRVARRKPIRAHDSPSRPARQEGRAGSSGLPRSAARVRPKAAARNVGRELFRRS